MVDVLNKVPREMLLIFKTNDCLRGIDSCLRTRFRSNAFITMSKTCTKVVFDMEIRAANGFWKWLCLTIQRTVALISIEFAQLALRFS